jgi:aspartate/methionine/tyrosine aminotransferase
MTGTGWMPSRALAERYPNLLALGGHPAVDMPPHVVEAAARAARRPAYAPTLGAAPLREAIAQRLSDELGWHVNPGRNVIVTVGGMQALHLAAQAFGRRSVTHAPAFFFPQLVAAAGGSCVTTGGADGPPDWEAFAAAIGTDTTLAIVNTPVNPTGYVFRRQDLDAIAAALRGSGALLLSDEAYAGLLYDGLPHLSPASHPELRARTLVLRSFSKTHAMAAWRVGFAVGPRHAIAAMARALAWQALAVDGVAQAAAHAALTGPQDWIESARAELAGMRPRAIEAANATGRLHAELPEGAAFIWAAVAGDEDGWSHRLAREQAISALPGRHFAARRPHLRIPFGGGPEAREQLLTGLRALTRSPKPTTTTTG